MEKRGGISQRPVGARDDDVDAVDAEVEAGECRRVAEDRLDGQIPDPNRIGLVGVVAGGVKEYQP